VVGDFFGPRLLSGSYRELCHEQHAAEDGRTRVFTVSTSMTDQHQRRQQNLRAMRSPASIALFVFSIAAVVLATIFYDHPIMKAPQLVASLRQHITAQ
jgi:Flp pilus assembly protein TadB